ncbi:DUF4232 domain-containing protein [Actinacidiphila soli]|uniref:DUF4232 domain-containing protein n=1 Tax=Actinacidiphila soli TaxID=2487275 RepID=UPI000FCCD602|nr:DUF4232 domain-containing protein [Actinacidiphila soli]
MTAKLNRAVRCTAAVLAVVALGAGATACSGSGSAAPATLSGTAAPATQSSSQAPTSTDTGSTTTLSSTSTGGSSGGVSTQGTRRPTDAANASSSAASSRCHTSELKFSWSAGSPDMNATNQQIAEVTLTNSGGRTCTLYGFPGVRLISKSGETWDLPRSTDKASTITLKPGDGTASITMTILPIPANTTDTRPFAPSKVLITPPDETTHVTLDWPYGGALWHRAGTTSSPETFVSPIGF